MADETTLLNAVVAHPEQDEPRLAYAEWCERQADATRRDRAEFIRLQLSFARTPVDPLHPPLRAWERAKTLLITHGAAWSNGLDRKVPECQFVRGFVERVRLPVPHFLEMAAHLFASEPIRHLDLTDVKPHLARLLESPHLSHLRSLDLSGQDLADDEAERLANCSHLSELHWLSLANNQVGRRGVEAFFRSPWFESLQALLLEGNPFDPRECYAADNTAITARWMPEEGAFLENVFGARAWMHGASDTVADWIPSRFA